MEIKRTVCKSNKEWRELRAHSFGASAVGILLGENHFTTPYQLAVRMRDELQGHFDYTQTLPMLRGHAYEQGVADLFSWQSGIQVIKASSAEYIVQRSDLPFLHASPDRTYWINPDGLRHGKNAEQNKGLLECKTTRMPIDPDNLPLSWVAQLQTQMGICGYSEGYIAYDCLSSPDGFGYCRFDFDQETFDSIVELVRDFWQRCIIDGQNPEPVNADDVIRQYPAPIEGKTLTDQGQAQALIQSILQLKQSQKEVEEAITQQSDRLKSLFADNEAIVDTSGFILATYKQTKPRTTIDTKKLQADFPEAYAACAKTGEPSRQLLLKNQQKK